MSFASQFLLCFLAFLLWASCIQFVHASDVTAKSGNIEVELKATWKKTSLVAEASEFIADWFSDSQDKFWKFLEQAAGNADHFSTDQKAYEWISSTVEKTFQFSPAVKQLLDFALSTHYFSPKLEAFNQLAAPFMKNNISISENFVVVQNTNDTNNVAILRTVEEVESFLSSKSLPKDHSSISNSMEVLPFDHVFAVNEKASHRLYLFTNIHSKDSLRLHQLLKQASHIEYVLRFFDKDSFSIDRKDSISNPDSDKLLSLQGYAVELQIKNMEYKQMDISVLEHKQHQDNTTTAEKIAQEKPFSLESIQRNFGVKAAQLISSAGKEGFLSKLIEVSQNVPQKLKEIFNTEITYDLDNELRENSNSIPPGRTFFALNGNGLDLDKLTVFSLLDLLKAEYNLYDTLSSLGIKSNLLQTLLFKEPTAQSSYRFQLFDDKERMSKLVTFFNDIEKDARYKDFPKQLKTMLEPSVFGQMRFARRNVIEAIIIADPSGLHSLHMLAFAFNMYQRGYPIRFGVMFAGKREAQKLAAHLAETPQFVDLSMTGDSQTTQPPLDLASFYQDSNAAQIFCGLDHLSKNFDLQRTMVFIGAVLQRSSAEGFSLEAMEKVFRDFTGVSLFEVISDTCLAQFHEANLFVIQKGLHDKMPFFLLNGALNSFENTNIQQAFFTAMNTEYENVLDLIRKDIITDKDSHLVDKMLEVQKAFKKYNPSIFAAEKELQFVSLLDLPAVKFIGVGDGSPKALSHILALDLNDKKGRRILLAALKYLQSASSVRVAVVHNSPKITQQTLALLKTVENGAIDSSIEFISSLLTQETETKMQETASSDIRNFLEKAVSSDVDYIITNGRVIAIPEVFELDDFQMLDALERTRTGDYSKRIFDTDSIEEEKKSEVVMKVSSVLNFYGSKYGTKQNVKPNFGGTHTVFHYNQERLGTVPEFIAAVNPLGEEAAKFGPLLDLMVNFFKLPTTIVLNPSIEESKDNVLVKRWYRFNIRPQLEFDENGYEKPLRTIFANFKSSPSILTLNMHVPETWLVESTVAIDDLDNINLEKSFAKRDNVSARYQLENIIISGSCLDAKSASSTRGLQLILGDLQENHIKDTLVMANFGYYQLKANPNTWEIRIAPGAHSDVYKLVDYSTNSFYTQRQQTSLIPVEEEQKIRVFVTSFDGPFVVLRVEKRPGMENLDLANVVTNKSSSLWASMFGTKNQDTINIFSIASGHMYERLLKIMILSVIRNTKKKPVKFWLIKNYFSPQFKEFLPHMAKKYNFEYEFVTYKWPHWLHKQVEKQRLIWAYKILFLDVLFPINVDKVIYIDADQVTRSDMSELWEMDLQGSPVGYTPFCDDKPEMDGYRFWKQGYWHSHLRGKNYHISALYVVDIQRLRQVYGGDQYRLYYDSLSKDPNSLSNLDQDLPNYAQHAVPIFSLPQDWLWCESWCSDTRKSKAKTIDLCNNPMTKEHKLESAKRIIPEWVDYDKEAQKLAEELHGQGLLRYTV